MTPRCAVRAVAADRRAVWVDEDELRWNRSLAPRVSSAEESRAAGGPHVARPRRTRPPPSQEALPGSIAAAGRARSLCWSRGAQPPPSSPCSTHDSAMRETVCRPLVHAGLTRVRWEPPAAPRSHSRASGLAPEFRAPAPQRVAEGSAAQGGGGRGVVRSGQRSTMAVFKRLEKVRFYLSSGVPQYLFSKVKINISASDIFCRNYTDNLKKYIFFS